MREQREDEAVSAAHVPFDWEVSEINSVLTSMMSATKILKDNDDEDDSSDDGDYDNDDTKKYDADVYESKIILILLTYKRTVAKEQGPYHESCRLCGPNILDCQRHHFVVPYDKVSDVAGNRVRCAICQQNSVAL